MSNDVFVILVGLCAAIAGALFGKGVFIWREAMKDKYKTNYPTICDNCNKVISGK